jgi:hypothetical protein
VGGDDAAPPEAHIAKRASTDRRSFTKERRSCHAWGSYNFPARYLWGIELMREPTAVTSREFGELAGRSCAFRTPSMHKTVSDHRSPITDHRSPIRKIFPPPKKQHGDPLSRSWRWLWIESGSKHFTRSVLCIQDSLNAQDRLRSPITDHRSPTRKISPPPKTMLVTPSPEAGWRLALDRVYARSVGLVHSGLLQCTRPSLITDHRSPITDHRSPTRKIFSSPPKTAWGPPLRKGDVKVLGFLHSKTPCLWARYGR